MTFIVPQVHKPQLLIYADYRNAERWTLVFAIGNLFLTSIASVCSVMGIFFWFYMFVIKDLNGPNGPLDVSDGLNFFITYVLFGAAVVFSVFSWIAFMFASFLMNGVFKKKPEHIKAYFVYGVVVDVLSLSAIMVWAVLTKGTDPMTVGIVLMIIMLYSMVLCMIRVTYKSYEHGNTLHIVTTEAPEKI